MDRRRQRQRRSQQPLLRQLAARHDGLRGARPGRLRAGGNRPDAAGGLQPDRGTAVDLLPEPVLRQRDGQGARTGRCSPTAPATSTTGRTDFWWDQYLGNTGNCWHDNTGKDGTPPSVTSTPPAPLLPSACDSSSVGTVGPQQEPELLNCLADIEFDTSHLSVVHDAVEAVGRLQSHQTPAPSLALICCIALLGGLRRLGGDDAPPASRTEQPAAASVGVGPQANCTDWKNGHASISGAAPWSQLRKFAGGPVGSSAGIQNGPVLDDDRAYKLLQSYCANCFARGFKLYKLYERAAAFVGH